MKKLFHTLLICLSSLMVLSQNLKINPVVDEKVELLSIVFRLANASEYAKCNIANYSNEIDTYFKSYTDDPLIKTIKEIRKNTGVSYDAVMSMATHLDINNDSINLKGNLVKESLDSRWGKYPTQFITQLNRFYNRSDFHKFYTDHAPLYSVTEKRFSEIINKIDLVWFEKFFGEKPKGSYNLIVSMASGGGNYGCSVKYLDEIKDIYSIICARNSDSLGYPVFSDKNNSVIIHEFAHSFCNPLVEKYYSGMEKAAGKLFNVIKDKMEQQAYGHPKIMLYESLVRATTIMYFKNHQTGESELNKMIGADQMNGFIAIKPLMKSLERYQNSIQTYGKLDSYMPEIVNLINSVHPDKLLKEAKCIGDAKIIDFSIKNNSTDVDPGISELTVKFDRAMCGSFGLNHGKKGKKHYPKVKSVMWNNGNTEITIKLTLEPNKEYSLKFPSVFILDENYCELSETYYLNFKTR